MDLMNIKQLKVDHPSAYRALPLELQSAAAWTFRQWDGFLFADPVVPCSDALGKVEWVYIHEYHGWFRLPLSK